MRMQRLLCFLIILIASAIAANEYDCGTGSLSQCIDLTAISLNVTPKVATPGLSNFYQQVVELRWKGAYPIDADIGFAFPEQLTNPEVWLDKGTQPIDYYPPLQNNVSCASMNMAYFNQTHCKETKQEQVWEKINDKFSYINVDSIENSDVYYVKNVTFWSQDVKKIKFKYKPTSKSGKWDLFAKPTSLSVAEAKVQNKLFTLDPLWSDPAGYAQGWYNLPNDFNVQPIGPTETDDNMWSNETNAAYPGGHVLASSDVQPFAWSETATTVGYIWRGGFTPGIYSIGFTQWKFTDPYANNFSVAVKNASEDLNYYVVGGTYTGYYVNTTNETTMITPGTDGVGILTYVNQTGILEFFLFGNGTEPQTGHHIFLSAINITNYTIGQWVSFTNTPTVQQPSLPIEFNGTNLTAIQYWWYDWDDNSTYGTNKHEPHTYSSTGDYNVCIIGEDYLATNHTTCARVRTRNLPYPWFTTDPAVITTGTLTTMKDLTYHGAQSGNSTNWQWSWGDGTANNTGTQNQTHTWTSPGTYVVILNTTNFWGLTNATHRTITIAGMNISVWDELSPTANLTFNITIANTTTSYYEENVDGSAFIWGNLTQGIPTGSISITVSSSGYQPRTYYGTYNDATPIFLLKAYLLNNYNGVLQPFIVMDTINRYVEGATIYANRTISGTSTLVAQEQTDATGSATMFLYPSALHYIKVTATGYSDFNTNIMPSTTTKVITLGSGGSMEVSGENSTRWVKIRPITLEINVTSQQIDVQTQDPLMSVVWFEVNISNHTDANNISAIAFSKNFTVDPSGGAITCKVNETYGLANLTTGSFINVSVFIYYNNSANVTIWKNYYVGGLPPMSARYGFELIKNDFSAGGLAMLTIIIALAAGTSVNMFVGFGGGFITLIVAAAFFVTGLFPYPTLFILATALSIISFTGKRWG